MDELKEEPFSEVWLKILEKLAAEQKRYEKSFRKMGASKKCARKMAKKAIIPRKSIYSKTFRFLTK